MVYQSVPGLCAHSPPSTIDDSKHYHHIIRAGKKTLESMGKDDLFAQSACYKCAREAMQEQTVNQSSRLACIAAARLPSSPVGVEMRCTESTPLAFSKNPKAYLRPWPTIAMSEAKGDESG